MLPAYARALTARLHDAPCGRPGLSAVVMLACIEAAYQGLVLGVAMHQDGALQVDDLKTFHCREASQLHAPSVLMSTMVWRWALQPGSSAVLNMIAPVNKPMMGLEP